MDAFDKYKSCKDIKTGTDCPDRKVGCHDGCEGYQFRCKERKKILHQEKMNSWKPTAHHTKVVIDFYKRKKKYRNLS